MPSCDLLVNVSLPDYKQYVLKDIGHPFKQKRLPTALKIKTTDDSLLSYLNFTNQKIFLLHFIRPTTGMGAL